MALFLISVPVLPKLLPSVKRATSSLLSHISPNRTDNTSQRSNSSFAKTQMKRSNERLHGETYSVEQRHPAEVQLEEFV